MNVTSLALVVGVVLALIAYVSVFARSRDRLRSGVGAIAGFAIGFAALRFAFAVGEWNEQREVEQRREQADAILLADPALAALKQYDAESYKKILFSISVEAPRPPGATAQGLIGEAHRAIDFTLVLDARLKRASDAAIVDYADALVAAADELAARDADLCARYLYESVDDATRFRDLLSAQTRQADTLAIAAVLRSASTAAQPIPDVDEVSRLALPVVDVLHRQFGADWQQMDKPYARNRDTATLCRVTIAFYRGVLRLPTAVAGKILRHHVRRHA